MPLPLADAKDKTILLKADGGNAPFTSQVKGALPPSALSRIVLSLASARGSGTVAPLGGNEIEGGGTTVSFGAWGWLSRVKTRKEGGNCSGEVARIVPAGGAGGWRRSSGSSPKTFNRMGAAASRPTWPGRGVPSARPTQTPTV